MYRSQIPVRFVPVGETPEAAFIKQPVVFMAIALLGIVSLHLLVAERKA